MKRKRTKTETLRCDFYCPKCGEDNSIGSPDVYPGDIHIVCPECGSIWRITVQFHEVEKP